MKMLLGLVLWLMEVIRFDGCIGATITVIIRMTTGQRRCARVLSTTEVDQRLAQ